MAPHHFAVFGITLALVLAGAAMSSPAAHAQTAEPQFESSASFFEGTPTRPPEPDSPGYTIMAEVRNEGAAAADMIVDIEIKSESGEKVAQWFWEDQDFPPGANLSYAVFWEPEQAGTYIVAVGVFTPQWAQTIHWNEPAVAIEAGDEERTETLSIWWPTDGAHVSGTQPFKALLEDRPLGEYDMFWQVDGNGLNPMYDSWEDWPHKEAMVDLSEWNWQGGGPYTVNFLAKDRAGNILAERAVSIRTSAESSGTAGDITICGRPGTRSFNACYYEGTNFETFKVQRDDGPQLDFDWGAGSPHPVMAPDGWSAEWRGLFDFEDGVYEFAVTTDDGFRLFVDTEEIISAWHDQPATAYTVRKTMQEAELRGVIAHYYENGGDAVAKLSWRKVE